ncbi:MAG: M23 family metallopeptidase [Pseudomonadota bacterium]
MQKFIATPFLLLVLLLASCSQPKAPVINRGNAIYDRNSVKNKSKNSANKTSASPTIISITGGETIYSVAKKYNVSLRDLINENNLTPPYVLKAGDKINLPSNQYYQVASGDTLYSISRKYGMNVNNLIAINNLAAPYSVKVGQKLKVNNSLAANTNNPQSSVAYKKAENQKNVNKNPEPEPTIAHKNNRFTWPIKGAIISKFGPKPGGLYNDGINIKAKNGDNVKATEDGVVAYVGNELRGYGNLIIIKHSGGWISAYAHLDKSKVKRGAKVKKGQNIATVGSTGNVKSAQLYFGLRKGREAVNPQTYL